MESIERILVLGGTRSGKSLFAERLLAKYDEWVYYATLELRGDDDESNQRVARHRSRRGPGVTTLELTLPNDLVLGLRSASSPLLIDSLGNFVASCLFADIDLDAELLAALTDCRVPWIVVSEEVGMSIHADTSLNRAFVDRLGTLNQAVAEVASSAWFVVAGLGLDLKRIPQIGYVGDKE